MRIHTILSALLLTVPVCHAALQSMPHDSVTTVTCRTEIHRDENSRPPLAVRISAGAGAVAINAAATEILKHSVSRQRPNGADDSSFPSRHTSWAFTASSIIANELYNVSPWYALGSQALASGVALQRVSSRHHYASDVAAGAATGIVSTQLSYWLCSKIFHSPAVSRHPVADNDFRPSVAVATEAICRLHVDASMGIGASVRGQMPLSGRWGLAATISASSTPLKDYDGKASAANSAGITVGGIGHFRLPAKSLAVESSVRVGAERSDIIHASARYGFEGDADIALNWRLTRKFAFATTVGYRLTTTRTRASAITICISSVSLF